MEDRSSNSEFVFDFKVLSIDGMSSGFEDRAKQHEVELRKSRGADVAGALDA